MTHLSKKAIERAVAHLVRFGDTDVFPHLCELHFLKAEASAIVEKLASLNLDLYQPSQANEVLSPKSKYGFRVVHQLGFLETILFTACLAEIGSDIEKLKLRDSDCGPFAYRFADEGAASFFVPKRTYRDWLIQQYSLARKLEFSQVIFTDIADFYQRIYFHRLETSLNVATGNKGVKRFIEKNDKDDKVEAIFWDTRGWNSITASCRSCSRRY